MKASEVTNALLLVLYKKHTEDSVIRQYGIYPWNLTDYSGIHFDDAGDALAAVERLVSRGWVEVDSRRKIRHLSPGDKIKLTEEGIDKAEELLKSPLFRHLKDIYTATVAGIIKGLKG